VEGFDLTLGRGIKPTFDDAPPAFRYRIAGVDYLRIQGLQGGDLYVTREGWPAVACLTPDRWYNGERFHKAGRALAGATGAVYRVPVEHRANPNFALVAKFSRVGQEVGITAVGSGLHDDPELASRLAGAEFLPPLRGVRPSLPAPEPVPRTVRHQHAAGGLFPAHPLPALAARSQTASPIRFHTPPPREPGGRRHGRPRGLRLGTALYPAVPLDGRVRCGTGRPLGGAVSSPRRGLDPRGRRPAQGTRLGGSRPQTAPSHPPNASPHRRTPLPRPTPGARPCRLRAALSLLTPLRHCLTSRPACPLIAAA